MSAWWSLPKAIPILLRHALAYAELAGEDLRAFQQRSVARLLALLVAGLGALFSLALICVAVVAVYWDTPYRLHAILGLLGVFVVVTVIGLLSARPKPAQGDAMFERVAREWREDRVILDQLLNDGEPDAAASAEHSSTSSRQYGASEAPHAGTSPRSTVPPRSPVPPSPHVSSAPGTPP